MNTVYNMLLTHKIRTVSDDLHMCTYLNTHTEIFYTYFWRVRLHISVSRPGLLNKNLCQKPETDCGS